MALYWSRYWSGSNLIYHATTPRQIASAPRVLKDDRFPVLRLPNELLLYIAEELDQPSQVLLSLTCKRFYYLCRAKLGLSFNNLSQRVDFLRILERDLPDYLTCQDCGWMFLWRSPLLPGYQCKRLDYHSAKGWKTSQPWMKMENRNYFDTAVTTELIDLVFRAYDYGPAYGLPLILLDTTFESARPGPYHDTINRFNQMRMIDGLLILYTSWQIEVLSQAEAAARIFELQPALCYHFPAAQSRWEIMRWAIPVPMSSRDTSFFKCRFCMTDSSLCVSRLSNRNWRIDLKVWRGYSNHSRKQNYLIGQQIFHTEPIFRQDVREVARRDLKGKFGTLPKHNPA